jgi:hypothetical protein
LQQHNPDQGKDQHEVDDNDYLLHQANIRSNRAGPGTLPRRRHLAI